MRSIGDIPCFLTWALLFSARAGNGFSSEAQFERANELYRGGRLEAAEAMYRLVLEQAPAYADAACNLGSLMQDLSRPDEAIQSYQNAIASKPDHADAHFNLGVMYQDGQRLDEAEQSYRRALEIDTRHPEAVANLGSVLQAQDKFMEAEETYRSAVAIVSVAPTLEEEERRGMLGTLSYSLGTILDRLSVTSDICPTGESCRDLAIAAYRNALTNEPDHALASHALASHLADGSVTTSSREYVTTLFDTYADTFDMSLAGLEYSAPDALTRAIARVLENKGHLGGGGSSGDARPLRATLDAGCGTGLLGPLIRNATQTLIGVDLSEKMVALAHEREIYDQLIVGDIEEALLSLRGNPIDLVAAADVFVYFGDMESTFEQVAEALPPGGLFAFTTERLGSSETDGAVTPEGAGQNPGFFLQTSGRFAHSQEYLETVAKGRGFTVEHYEHIVPRFELGKPIQGQLFVFSSSSS